MIRMSDRRKDLRPREKLQARGAEALSDYELLMAIIGSGTQYADVTKLAREVQKLLKEKGSELAYEDLLNVKSLGPAKATNIMAGFELWRRQFEVSERPIIDSPEKAVEQLVDIRDKKLEQVKSNEEMEQIAQGTYYSTEDLLVPHFYGAYAYARTLRKHETLDATSLVNLLGIDIDNANKLIDALADCGFKVVRKYQSNYNL